MSINEDTPPKWEDTQPVEEAPPKWEDTQPTEPQDASVLDTVKGGLKTAWDAIDPLNYSEEEKAKIRSWTPGQMVAHAASDAFGTASIALPLPGASGIPGALARTGVAAGLSGSTKAAENYAEDRPVMEGVGKAALIGGGVNAGLEAIIAPAVLAGRIAQKGGKWVMDKSAEALFGGKLTKEMLESPTIQETINKVVSAKNAGLSAIGMGKSFKGRVADEAKLAEDAYSKAFNAIPDERIPIDEVFTPEMRSNLDVLPEDNMVRNQIPAFVKKTEARLEPISFKNERLGKEAQQRSSALNKKEELRRIIEEKRAAKLSPIQSKFDEDLLAAKQLDLEKANKAATNTSGTANEAEYLKRKAELEGIVPQSNEELIARNNELRQLERQFKTRSMREGFEEPSMADLTRREFEAQKSLAESQLAPEIDPLYKSMQEIGRELPPPIPKETTLREAYNVANNPIKGDINPLENTLGARVRELGGESVVAADAARQTSQTMNDATKAAIGADSNRATGADAALAIISPKIWVAKATAAHPELRYVLGKNAEALGKWGDKLEEAYKNGGAKAVNVLVNTLNQTDPEFRQAHAGNQQVSPYQEGAEKPQIKKPELSRDEFLKNLGSVESAGKYDATNPNSSATGKYQFLWKTWGEDVSRWAGAPVSQKMFLSNPKLQDLYMKDHHDTTLMQGAKTLRDSSPNAAKRSDTELKALIHFKGLEGARKYLDQGVDDTSANNMGVEDYLKKVGGG